MQFRRLNDAGVAAFRDYLGRLRADPAAAPPTGLLTDPVTSEPLVPPISADPEPFPSRMAFARWLHAAGTTAGRPVPRDDAGFWAWLSLALFDTVCPTRADGHRKANEDARYIPMLEGARRYYRHALLGPYLIFETYADAPNRTAAFLCGTLHKLTDEAYRLFSENQLVSYTGALAVLNYYYFDAALSRIKRGAQTKKPGSIRRLVKLLSQLSRTYDLDVLSDERLESILPAEFDRWRGEHGLFDPTLRA